MLQSIVRHVAEHCEMLQSVIRQIVERCEMWQSVVRHAAEHRETCGRTLRDMFQTVVKHITAWSVTWFNCSCKLKIMAPLVAKSRTELYILERWRQSVSQGDTLEWLR